MSREDRRSLLSPTGRTEAVAVATLVAVDVANLPQWARSLPYATGAGVLLAGVALLWFTLPQSFCLPASARRWLFALPAASLAMNLLAHAEMFLPGSPPWLAPLCAMSLVIVLVAGGLGRVGWLFASSLVVGLAFRALAFTVVPIDPGRADMLPLVIVSVRHFLGGESPYRLYHFPSAVPLTYLPLGWLPFLPLEGLGKDVRWTNSLAELGVLVAILFATRRPETRAPREAALTLWCAWFLSRGVILADQDTAAPVQWAAIAWVAALAIEMPRHAPLGFGAGLATTPLVLPFAPLIAVRAYRAKKLWRTALVSGAVALALILPWFLASPRGFIDGTVLWFNDLDVYPRHKWEESQAWANFSGFTGLFWTCHLERLLKPLQAALMLLITYRFVKRPAAPLAPYLAGTFIVFMLLNPIVWGYLWQPASVLAMIACAVAAPPAKP